MKKETILKLLPFAAVVLIVVFFGATLSSVSIEDILHLTPDSYLLAALTFLGLYAVKSVSIVFPLVVLYLAAGAVFPLGGALLVSLLGLWLCVTIPFCIGRFSGREAVEKLAARYPKAQKLSDFFTGNAVFCSYLLRVVNLLSGDLVSMVLGASGMGYLPYTVGSLLGLCPVMVPAVLMGQNLAEPFSPQFWAPLVAIVLISLISSLLYNRYQKRKRGA